MNTILLLISLALQSQLDASGWTVLTPSADTRKIHVSNSGLDTNDGLSETTPVATISKAQGLLRHGFPDWMVLKNGDTFVANQQIRKCGRSSGEPMVFTGYGSGPRPIINGQGFTYTGTNWGAGYSLNHLAIVGIDFRDNGVGGKAIDLWGGVDDILIEGNAFSNYRLHVQIAEQPLAPVPLKNITIRRNTFADASTIGILIDKADTLLLEENIVDRSGHGGTGPINRNHNVYVNQVKNLVARNNIFSRGSNYGLKLAANSGVPGSFTDFTIDNNLFFNNAFSTSHSSGLPVGTTTYMFQRGMVQGNVFTEIGRLFSDGSKLDLAAWLQNMSEVQFVGNHFVHKNQFHTDPMFHWGNDDRHENITIRDSVVYDWHLGGGGASQYFEFHAYDPSPMAGVTNLQLINNQINQPAGNYTDPTRSVGSYNASLGRTNDAAEFLTAARSMSRANWNTAYTADSVNDFIRAGFVAATPIPDPDPDPDPVPDPDPIPDPDPTLTRLEAALLAAAKAFVAAMESF